MVFLARTLFFLLMIVPAANAEFFCRGEISCDSLLEIQSLIKVGAGKPDIIEKIRAIALRQNAQTVDYDLSSNEPEEWSLILIDRPIVAEIKIEGVSEEEADTASSLLSLRQGDDFGPRDLKDAERKLREFYRDQSNTDINLEVFSSPPDKDNESIITFKISGITKLKVAKVAIEGELGEFKYIGEKILRLKGQNFNRNNLQILTEQIELDLSELGYAGSNVDWKMNQISKEEVELKFSVTIGRFYAFHFEGAKEVSRNELLTGLKIFIKDGSEVTEKSIQKKIEDSYLSKGYYYSDIRVSLRNGIESKKNNSYVFVNIKEGERIRLNSVEFNGNFVISQEQIINLFKENSSDLIKNDFYDLDFLSKFSGTLKKKYRSLGFLLADVSEPQVKIEKNKADVTFNIIERQQTVIEDVQIVGLASEMEQLALSKFKLKKSTFFDVTIYESEVKSILEFIKEQGYYFAAVKNVNLATTLKYNKDLSRVKIIIDVNPGYRVKFGKVVLAGLYQTRDEVILRELDISNGELITPDKIENLRQRLESLNLFSVVKINLINLSPENDQDSFADLLLTFNEKDFGYGEFAPGYRTDLGMKLSLSISYGNLWGLNHGIGVKFQINRRIDFSYLDSRRRSEEKRLVEYTIESTYKWPFLFNFMDLFIDTSFQRKRFYAFDADIGKIAPRLHKQLNDELSIGLQYQFETVSPFDATEIKDRDSFRIGSITPSILYDFRDKKVRPTKGASFSMSFEKASPGLGAQNSKDLKIDFYKVVSRNKAYVSFGDFTFAFYAAAGVEQNQSKEVKDGIFNLDGTPQTVGYIPSIKVFRLDAVDTIRGFGESEINRLKSGTNINEVRVQDMAYFSVFKFEPRYSLSDVTVLGIFFDAGRVSVDTFQPLDLRTSSGISFKYVTPVGTLDFDYGIKLHRETLSNGGQESFGRFHLSIGVF